MKTKNESTVENSLDVLRETLNELESVRKPISKIVSDAQAESQSWKSRFDKARGYEKRATSDDGTKAMSMLANQAQSFFDVTDKSYKEKKAHLDGIDENMKKLRQVIHELESLDKLDRLNAHFARMDINADMGTETQMPTVDDRKIQLLLLSSQELISLKR